MTSYTLSKIMFVFACASIVFMYGLIVGRYEIFPYSIFRDARQVFSERDTLLGLRPSEFIQPARYEGNGVTRLQSEQMVPGLTFVTGFFDGGNEMRLVRPDGSLVNQWRVRFFDIFPDPQHIKPTKDIPKSEWNVSVHGSHILPDGSVVFNFTYKGAAKIDRCGRLEWVIPRMTHHSISAASAGHFWIPASRYIDDESTRLHLQPPYLEDTVLKVSQNGEILNEISVLDILFRNNLQGMIYAKNTTGDLTHLNDVEELDAELARRFPQFEAGDLLLSTRFQHLVMVVDPETLRVKWYQAGPWIGQHDPDFMTSGEISVFSNNNYGATPESRFGGSSIIEIDPEDRQIHRRYGARPDQPMFTYDRGKHQRLGDGDSSILVTEARAGRIFEVDANDRVVWEYINRFDEDNVAAVTGATRYSEDYFTVRNWSCA